MTAAHTKIANLDQIAGADMDRVERLLGTLHPGTPVQAPTTIERADLLLSRIEDAREAFFTTLAHSQREHRALLGRLAKATRNLLLAAELLDQARHDPQQATRRRMRTIGELLLDQEPHLDQVEETLSHLIPA